MKEVAELLNTMIEEGILSNYAIFGAIAQMRYTEAVATLDADILISVPDEHRLDLLNPIYEFCKKRGYQPEGEAVKIGPWPVQFIPAFDDLTKDALRDAEDDEVQGAKLRVVRADYLATIALSVGRPKDYARVLAFLENGAANEAAIGQLCSEYDLSDKWILFRKRFFDV